MKDLNKKTGVQCYPVQISTIDTGVQCDSVRQQSMECQTSPAAITNILCEENIVKHNAGLGKLLKSYKKVPQEHGPPDHLTWFLKKQTNQTKKLILAYHGVVLAKKNPDKRELIKILRDSFLIDRHLSVDAAIQQFGKLCLLKGIAVKRVVPATADQLIATSAMEEDSILFQTAPSCQDSIEILSSCEWDSQRSERLGLTKPEIVVVAQEE